LLDLGAESAGAQVALAHQQWQAARAAAREAGAKPLHRLQTVTAAARAIAEEDLVLAEKERASLARPGDDLRFEEVPDRDASRAGGARFGTLVHAVLALADLRAPAEERASQAHALAASAGRSLGAPAAESAQAARAAEQALAHPLMRRAAQSADCRREVELFRVEPAGTILEGVADLAFREETPAGARWLVVDFKTDLHPQAEPKYFAQLRLYARAIAEATGEPATPVLFAV
jgi:ATP-dependent exoDNAse (exonuclease V) beta subunit